MFVRVLVVVALLDRALIFKLLWPLGTMTVVVLAAAAFLWLNQNTSTPRKNAGNAEELNP